MREGETARILCDLSYSIKNKVGLHELEKVLASRAIQPTGPFQGRNCIKNIYFNLIPTEGSISVTGTGRNMLMLRGRNTEYAYDRLRGKSI